MLRQTIFLVACLTLVTLACKSDSKEATTETTADTTMVTQPLVEVSLDTAAVAEENKKTAPAPAATTTKPAASKPAATSKPAPADKTTATAPAPAAAAADADGYVEFPSKRASYPGGEPALNKFLADNIKYPAMAREKNVQGTVYAHILVDELGNIVNVSFPRPLGSGLEEEVLRVINSMPDLIPAEDHSKPVKTKYVLPVKFKLQ